MCNQRSIDQINNAIGAHGAWKMRLRSAISTGKGDINSLTAGRDDLCEFGKWLNSPELDAETRAGMPYQVVRRLHTEFHRTAGRVLGLVEARHTTAANACMSGEFTERSEKLVRAMMKWKGQLQNQGGSIAA